MLEQASDKGAQLHRLVEPFDKREIAVSGGHTIYLEQSGKKNGEPVVVLHGGPGGGCHPGMRRFFDPDRYRVVLFDQRGCGKSKPHASVDNNTTWDLISDIETIRDALGIEKWVVFGGSWGATLSLLYAQTHPDRARALILRGVFTMTQAELDWFYAGGAARYFPEAWQTFVDLIPEDERDDLVAAYHKRLFGEDDSELVRHARAWARWENALATMDTNGVGHEPSAYYARAFARIENHYFTHNGWLREDGQIMNDLPKIAHLPAYIVQGRYDMVCPPHTAYNLHKAWPGSVLRLVKGGHAMSEPAIAAELLNFMDNLPKDR